jgi:phosphoglycerate kinase
MVTALESLGVAQLCYWSLGCKCLYLTANYMHSYDDIRRMRDFDLMGRRVFLRADLDVRRSPYGTVLDDLPLRFLLPTLRMLVQQRAKVIIGASFPTEADFQRPHEGIAARLGQLLGVNVSILSVNFVPEFKFLEEGQVAFTPNLSVIEEDSANDADWAAKVAESIDIYLLEGLQAARERGATIETLPRFIAARGVGPLVSSALEIYKDVVEAPAAPMTLVVGGPSVRRIAPLVHSLMPSCSDILLGGTVGNTFMAVRGWQSGASPIDEDGFDDAQAIIAAAALQNVGLHYPVDAVVQKSSALGESAYDVRRIDDPLSQNESVVDVATETCLAYRDVLARSTTALWVGLMGDCTVTPTQAGSLRIGQAVGEAKRAVVAGEDTVAGAVYLGLDGHLRMSPGGDAALALLSGETMLGLESLRK